MNGRIKMVDDKLKNLGFDKWFADRCDMAGFRIARIISVHKERYVLTDGLKDTGAQVVGKLMFGAESSLDFPTVGDWVRAQYYDDDSLAIIHDILPRRSLLRRKTSGKNIAFQLIAANIDTALIMQSLDANFNLRRLERYLVMINESRISPVVLLSKSDLLDREGIQEKISAIERLMPDLPAVPFSSEDGFGLEEVRNLLLPRKTYCLLGSSGVGKTTLLNHLVGRGLFETRQVREKDSKGRHTTTQRQLIRLQNGAMVIDSPGMRELGILSSNDGLEETFADIVELAGQCRFDDCTHVNELGCAVLEALHAGRLPERRFQNFVKINKEAAFNEMSYLEKRKKDRQFGKMIKTVMKSKKNRR